MCVRTGLFPGDHTKLLATSGATYKGFGLVCANGPVFPDSRGRLSLQGLCRNRGRCHLGIVWRKSAHEPRACLCKRACFSRQSGRLRPNACPYKCIGFVSAKIAAPTTGFPTPVGRLRLRATLLAPAVYEHLALASPRRTDPRDIF